MGNTQNPSLYTVQEKGWREVCIGVWVCRKEMYVGVWVCREEMCVGVWVCREEMCVGVFAGQATITVYPPRSSGKLVKVEDTNAQR